MKKNIENIARRAEVSEKSIERYLIRRVEELGGVCLKYSNFGQAGYPDRICMLPGGYTAWVELKSKDGRVSTLQSRRMTALLDLGQNVFVCYSREDVERAINHYFKHRR